LFYLIGIGFSSNFLFENNKTLYMHSIQSDSFVFI